jgi:Domain of unknown function (DUF4252)
MRGAPRSVGWRMLWAVCAVACLSSVGSATELRLPEFDSLRAKASDSVVISLDEDMLRLAGQFLDPADPGDANAKAAIRGLKSIYVRSFSFEKPYQVPSTEIATLRSQLAAPRWRRVVQTHSEADHSDVDIYLAADADHAQGLVIIVTEPREFTVVSISGAIDLARLHSLEGHLGVPRLPASQ